MTPALEVVGLTYELPGTEGGRGGRGAPAPRGRAVVADVSFTVGAGETLVLLGRSGSGKTTTLKLINRLLEPTRGEVRVAGRRAADEPPTRLRRQIGYVIQEVGLFPHFTVARNVGLVPELEGWPRARIAARVRELLGLVGLDPEEFAQRYPHQLSGGQRQRVGVARALAADPPLLLLDEPFGALDPVTRAELQREFRALEGRLGKGIVFVTHDVREGLLLGTRIGLMHGGRLAFLGTPEQFRESDRPECREFLDAMAAV
jgi:osmoprotectant transport system ATP-binding protein